MDTSLLIKLVTSNGGTAVLLVTAVGVLWKRLIAREDASREEMKSLLADYHALLSDNVRILTEVVEHVEKDDAAA